MILEQYICIACKEDNEESNPIFYTLKGIVPRRCPFKKFHSEKFIKSTGQLESA